MHAHAIITQLGPPFGGQQSVHGLDIAVYDSALRRVADAREKEVEFSAGRALCWEPRASGLDGLTLCKCHNPSARSRAKDTSRRLLIAPPLSASDRAPSLQSSMIMATAGLSSGRALTPSDVVNDDKSSPRLAPTNVTKFGCLMCLRSDSSDLSWLISDNSSESVWN